MAKSSKVLTTGIIASALGLQLQGDDNVRITRISSLQNADPGSICFIVDKKKLEMLANCKASAMIIPSSLDGNNVLPASVCILLSDNPYLSYAKLTQLWVGDEGHRGKIHPSAIIDPEAVVAEASTIGACAVISAGAVVAEDVRIDAGVFVGDGAVIGKGSRLHANATVHHQCIVGEACEVHSGAVIGADGFGFAPARPGWEKIFQLGRVVIGDRVSVGACTSIDRGALDDTTIADGVILDNQIQVAHNVSIGKNTAIAGCTGIAGSTTIGSNCLIGGAVSIVGHIDICDDVMITANSFVNRSINERGSYSSGVPIQNSATWRKNAVRLRKLDTLSRDLSTLAQDVSSLSRDLENLKSITP